jgi:hypothetical protein
VDFDVSNESPPTASWDLKLQSPPKLPLHSKLPSPPNASLSIDTNTPIVDPFAHLPVGVIVPNGAQAKEPCSHVTGKKSFGDAPVPAAGKNDPGFKEAESRSAECYSGSDQGQGVIWVNEDEKQMSIEEKTSIEAEAQRAEAKAKARAAGIEARKRAEAAMAANKKPNEQAGVSAEVGSQPPIQAKSKASVVENESGDAGITLKGLRGKLAAGLLKAVKSGNLGDALRNQKASLAVESQQAQSSANGDHNVQMDSARQKAANALLSACDSGELDKVVLDSTRQKAANALFAAGQSDQLAKVLTAEGSAVILDSSDCARVESAKEAVETEAAVIKIQSKARQKDAKKTVEAKREQKKLEQEATRLVVLKQGVAEKMLSMARSGMLTKTLCSAAHKPQETRRLDEEQLQVIRPKVAEILVNAARNGTLEMSVKKVSVSKIQEEQVCKTPAPGLPGACQKEKVAVCQSPIPGPNETFEFQRPTLPATPKSSHSSRPGSRARAFKRPPAPPSPALD